VFDRNFLCRTMVCTRASEAASSLVAQPRLCQAPLQEAQDPESELEAIMDIDTKSDDTVGGRPVPGEPI
jgi:hypothetical protein